MFQRFLFAIILIHTLAAHATDQGLTSLRLTPTDPYYPIDMAGSDVKVEKPGLPRSEVLPQSQRNQVSTKIGLNKFIQNWDDLDQDMLFLRAKNESLGELKARYPAIPKKLLLNLINYLHEQA